MNINYESVVAALNEHLRINGRPMYEGELSLTVFNDGILALTKEGDEITAEVYDVAVVPVILDMDLFEIRKKI